MVQNYHLAKKYLLFKQLCVTYNAPNMILEIEMIGFNTYTWIILIS